ncbi:MAG: hypothetical protein WD577_05295 [Bacteroidales bacterium]
MTKKRSIIDVVQTASLVKELGEKIAAELLDQLEQEIGFFREIASGPESLIPAVKVAASSSMGAFSRYNDRLGKLIAGTFLGPDDLRLKEIFREYARNLETSVAGLPKTVTLLQSEERFRPLPGDNYRVRYHKRVKRMIRGLQVTGLPIVNFSRRIAGREALKMPAWHHQVAVRQIYRVALRNSLLEELSPVFEEVIYRVNAMHYRLLQLDSRLSELFFQNGKERVEPEIAGEFEKEFRQELKKLDAEMKEVQKSVLESIEKAGEDALKRYYSLEHVSGTVEFPESKSAVRTINRAYARLLLELDRVVHAAGNAGHFIFDDWRFDTALNGLSLQLMQEENSVHHILGEKLRSDLETFSGAYKKIIENRKVQISKNTPSQAAMRSMQREFKPEFTSLLIRSLSALKKHDLPRRLQNINAAFSNSTSALPETRILVRKFDPSRSVRDRDVIRVRLADILHFEVIPEVRQELESLALETADSLETLYNQLSGIGAIAEFSIESAIKQASEQQEDKKESATTLEEGLERSVEKVGGIMKFYSEMEGKLHQKLTAVIGEQVKRLQELRENEKVFSLNLQLARIRFRKQLNKRIVQIRQQLGSFFSRAIHWPAKLGGSTSGKVGELFSRVIRKSSAGAITAELSAFLSESKEAFARLPYIYQRLYLVEPLTDDLFYYPREEDSARVDNAITSWENGHYSPLAIVCEKGSGATSFINRYRSGIKKYETLQVGSLEQIHAREDFLAFLADRMGLKSAELTTVVEEINKGGERIVFLEDLQNLYLRTVDGFDALKTLFTLMSLTNQKVLWITSCTKYAWEYLELTLHIAGFFNGVIRLSQFGDEAIRELILKRHAISGYSIRYFPNKYQAKSRQYRKLSSPEKQSYLEEKYFASLNKFAQGNISLALHFWLRSTKEVQDRQIIISALYESDYSFLETLTRTQLVVLTMIALHDGINAHQLSQILRRPEEEAAMELNQLYDDSVIVKRELYFLINPLLYRQVVEFLTRKNFIH